MKLVKAAKLIGVLSFVIVNSATAQTWKPICVNGSNTTGAHNSTWQKVNTTTAGGSTWKRLGECKPATPPGPPPFDGIPINIYISANNLKKPATSTFEVRGDGTWYASWDRWGSISWNSPNKDREGRWLAAGYSPADFEISWTVLENNMWISGFKLRHEVAASSGENTFYPLGAGWKVWLTSYEGDWSFERTNIKVKIAFTIRKRDNPSVVRNEIIELNAYFDDGQSAG